MVARRVAGEPLEQVVGFAEFFGLRIVVAPGVFVPRQRSIVAGAHRRETACAPETWWSTCAAGPARSARHCSACCRTSRCTRPTSTRPRSPALGGTCRRTACYEGDLYDALPDHLRGRVNAIVANAPYVPTDAIATMPPEARDHEHRVALDGGADGLDIQRRVIAGAPALAGAGRSGPRRVERAPGPGERGTDGGGRSGRDDRAGRPWSAPALQSPREHRRPRLHVVGPRVGDRRDRRGPDRHRPAVQRPTGAPAAVRRQPVAPRLGRRPGPDLAPARRPPAPRRRCAGSRPTSRS